MNENDMPVYPDTREGARNALRFLANEEVNAKVDAGLANGSLELVPDPEVKHVWGVTPMNARDATAYVVIYLRPLDFVCNSEWLYA